MVWSGLDVYAILASWLANELASTDAQSVALRARTHVVLRDDGLTHLSPETAPRRTMEPGATASSVRTYVRTSTSTPRMGFSHSLKSYQDCGISIR
jgi:hypothetical protein